MADVFSVAFGSRASGDLSARMLGRRSNAEAYMSADTYQVYAQLRDTQQQHIQFGTERQVEELKARINGVVDSRQIEWAQDVVALQLANDATQRYLLAFPAISRMHKLGSTEAYGREYQPQTNKLLLSRIQSGLGGIKKAGDYNITHYADNYKLDNMNELSQYDQLVLLRNNQLALAGIDEDFDPCSTMCGCF